MPISFYNTATHEEFYRNHLSSNDFKSVELIESKETISFENATMTFQNWCFEGFRIGYSKLIQETETRYQIANDIDSIKIYFNLKGETLFRYKQFKQSFNVKAGQYNMFYSTELDTEVTHGSSISEILSLQLNKNHFASLLEGQSHSFTRFGTSFASGRAHMFSEGWSSANFAIQKCLHDIISSEYMGDLKKLYLHSRIYELLFLFANATSEEQTKCCTISSRDKERLEFLRAYISEHYNLPLSLKLLCKLSELNEFKLKNGFKQLFGTPVIEYVIQCKLEQARRLLLDKAKNVSEVAYEVGYSSPEYFSRAFKKRYGYSPSKR
jgi:AraC family transcriptional regulator, transcriptional activator of the genes for pyochelin and ferripyochelin receptors